ncbi:MULTISPECIES: nitroreductase family protein [Bacillus]|uniref:Hypothetical Cytosolic Protein n=2 Tax=Bacillus cereus TaxID=1396 RepID=Q812K1_BACCR|nr:hypothetical protein [Bacillus cereus]AAP11989.1 hypothetical Cytosolic Protein [Bacillus cereus ATCC 14579]KZD83371.1 putative Cytosolic Protein [Bacillus cereus]MCC3288471.1 hypothetical protein [Bacillus cereus]MEB9997479.1 hypothetical protein [Bacillus cereus]OOR43926.1 hypothetical protein BW896_21760 [Bacillus cereus]
MSLLINDPMVQFPKQPKLIPNIHTIYYQGVTIYGPSDGPFKLNGTLAAKLVYSLFPLLEQGITLEEIYEKSDFAKEDIDKLLEILFMKGCLVQAYDNKELTNQDRFFIRKMTKFKNHTNLEDIYQILQESIVYIICDEEALTNKIQKKLSKYGLNAERLFIDEYMEVKTPKLKKLIVYISDSDFNDNVVSKLSDKLDVLYVDRVSGQIGPIFSKKAITTTNYLHHLIKTEKNSIENYVKEDILSDYISILLLREIGKISNNLLTEGYYRNVGGMLDYQVIDKRTRTSSSQELTLYDYEVAVQFPASKYVNKTSHLTHFKEKNLKLGIFNQASFLWKKLDSTNSVPKNVDGIFKYTMAYKNHKLKFKRYTPSGGNINSNLLFYINLEVNSFDGLGIYFYNNFDSQYYQVRDFSDEDISNFYKNIIMQDKKNDVKGYFIIANDTDLISQKYENFSFKIANLNTGVMLSQLFSIRKYFELNCRMITQFNEREILNLLGIKKSNEVVNFIIEVN